MFLKRFLVELILGILAGYGVPHRYSIFSNYELFILYPRIPLKQFVLILIHVINIPIVVSGGIRFFASNKEAVLKR